MLASSLYPRINAVFSNGIQVGIDARVDTRHGLDAFTTEPLSAFPAACELSFKDALAQDAIDGAA